MKKPASKYKVEKNVPMTLASHAVYPFAEMEIGDSFAFEPERYNSVRRSATYFGGSHGCKFSVSGIHNRCWRRS